VAGISVIIPAHNRALLIGETLCSLLAQTIPADEIIVVDDGSTDDTASVAESFGDRVVVLRQENKGPAAARNAGFSSSRGEFVHFFDSDDIALPNKHEVQLRALEESGADIAYGPWMKGRFSKGGLFRPDNHVLQQKGLPQGDLIQALLTNWSIVPHACLFRRSIVEKSGGFPEHLFIGEDQMMFLNSLLAGARVVHSPGTMELYRLENDCKLTSPEAGQKRRVIDWARFLLAAEASCLRHGRDPARWYGFRRRAWEALEDLRIFNVDNAILQNGLKAITERASPSFYKELRQLERWKGGIQQRLTGGRAARSFRMGLITREQVAQLNAAGYLLAH